MKCEKCWKEYSDDFGFCPFCGEKNALLVTKGSPVLPNIDFIKTAWGKEDFETRWDEFKKMTASEFYDWLVNGKNSLLVVYTILYFTDIETEKARIRERIISGNAARLDEYEIRQAYLRKSRFGGINRNTFKTREECEKILSDLASYAKAEEEKYKQEKLKDALKKDKNAQSTRKRENRADIKRFCDFCNHFEPCSLVDFTNHFGVVFTLCHTCEEELKNGHITPQTILERKGVEK